jgi:hypothetical protein
MAGSRPEYEKSVFINCPYDAEFEEMFLAIEAFDLFKAQVSKRSRAALDRSNWSDILEAAYETVPRL